MVVESFARGGAERQILALGEGLRNAATLSRYSNWSVLLPGNQVLKANPYNWESYWFTTGVLSALSDGRWRKCAKNEGPTFVPRRFNQQRMIYRQSGLKLGLFDRTSRS